MWKWQNGTLFKDPLDSCKIPSSSSSLFFFSFLSFALWAGICLSKRCSHHRELNCPSTPCVSTVKNTLRVRNSHLKIDKYLKRKKLNILGMGRFLTENCWLFLCHTSLPRGSPLVLYALLRRASLIGSPKKIPVPIVFSGKSDPLETEAPKIIPDWKNQWSLRESKTVLRERKELEKQQEGKKTKKEIDISESFVFNAVCKAVFHFIHLSGFLRRNRKNRVVVWDLPEWKYPTR